MESKIHKWLYTAKLISKSMLNSSGKHQQKELEEWSGEKERHQKILNDLNDPRYYHLKYNQKKELDRKYSWENFMQNQQKRRRHKQQIIIRYAAGVLLFFSVGSILWYYQNQKEVLIPVKTSSFSPGSSKALLVLEDGREISLHLPITFTEKDGTVIKNTEKGEIMYNTARQETDNFHYNTLRVPQGGEYRIVLADGTKVWINSESELAYPTQFSGNKREVTLKGEAYFEIAPNPAQPFYVNCHDIRVLATGTAFNVTAYEDEPDLKVTLIEGGVDIESNTRFISRLLPNQQFCQNRQNSQYKILEVDPRTATAWKNGYFFFEEESLQAIIRKLSRWYGIRIICQPAKINAYRFSGEIRKYEEAVKVLEMLKLTNEITYTIQPDRQIIIYSTE